MLLTSIAVLSRLAEDNRLMSDSLARKLSDAQVRAIRPAPTPMKFADGGGLTLYVPPTGAMVWRYRFRLEKKEQTLTIGTYPEVSLALARTQHRAAIWLVSRGTHPLHHIKAALAQDRALARFRLANTFQAVAQRWMQDTNGNLARSTAKHRLDMLGKHIMPALACRPIDTITRKELHALLTEIDRAFPITATQCRGYIKQIFDYAVDAEIIDTNPVPRRGVLLNAANRRAKPHKALPIERLGEFLKTLEDAPKTALLTKAALRLVVLTWCRTSEVIGARWEEMDFANALWSIPAERMKAKETHTLHLSRQAMELLQEVRGLSEGQNFVFPNRSTPHGHMARTVLINWRKRWGFSREMDIHGFRAMASTWANETGKYRPDVIEAALAHRESDRVRAAYNRADFSRELRQMWQEWADICDERTRIARAGNVVPLRLSARA